MSMAEPDESVSTPNNKGNMKKTIDVFTRQVVKGYFDITYVCHVTTHDINTPK